MKVLVVDLDGMNNGPLIRNVLLQRYSNAEVKVVSASKDFDKKKPTRKFTKGSKEHLGIELEAVPCEVATAEHVQWADKIVFENKNNQSLLTRRIEKSAFEGKHSYTLKEKLKSGRHVKAPELEAHLKEVHSLASTLDLTATPPVTESKVEAESSDEAAVTTASA